MMNMIDKNTLNLIRKKNKTIHFNITNKCNVKCRHCINSHSDTVLGEAEENMVLSCLDKVRELGYKKINIVGGEPFLKLDLLKKIIDKATELGIIVGITTNAYWASSVEKAEDILEQLHNVKLILLSTDFFHMENIPMENIKNAVTACKNKSVSTAINTVCLTKSQQEKLKDILSWVPKDVFVNYGIMMPFGGAKDFASEVERDFCPKKKDEIPDFCDVEENYVDCEGGLYTCCMSTLCTTTKQFCFGNLYKQNTEDIFTAKDTDGIYKLVSGIGIRGLVDLLEECKSADLYLDKKYSSQCEFCVSVLNDLQVVKELKAKLN